VASLHWGRRTGKGSAWDRGVAATNRRGERWKKVTKIIAGKREDQESGKFALLVKGRCNEQLWGGGRFFVGGQERHFAHGRYFRGESAH